MHDLQRSATGLYFRLSATATLKQQPRNHTHQERHGSEYGYYQPAVSLPRRKLTKPHDAAGRQARFTNVPTLELSPVIHRRSQLQRRRLDMTRCFAAEDA